jgi:DNA-binding response OmpR family regulator
MAKILVVDDEPLVSEVVSEFLDAEVTCALTGMRGAQMILSGQFDLAVIDVLLPDCSGLELVALAANENLPVLVTAERPESWIELGRTTLPFLPKPFDRSELVSKAREILGATAENLRRVKLSVARLRATGDSLAAAMAESSRLLKASHAIIQDADRRAPTQTHPPEKRPHQKRPHQKRIVLVHDDPEFGIQLTAALTMAGYLVMAFTDPMLALDRLDADPHVKMLITRAQFPPGKPDGITLARMARIKRAGIRVLLMATPEYSAHTEEFGAFMPAPVGVHDVVATVSRLLQPDDLH